IPFFMLHYGIFTLVHGVFVFLMIFGAFNFLFMGMFNTPLGQGAEVLLPMDFGGIVLVWAIATVIQIGSSFFQQAEELPSVQELFLSPYKRVIALHLTVLFGAFLIGFLGWPPIAAVLLVILHVITDLPTLVRKK